MSILLFIAWLLNGVYTTYSVNIINVNEGENVSICIPDSNITNVNWTFTPNNYNVFSYQKYNIPIHSLSLPVNNKSHNNNYFNLISFNNETISNNNNYNIKGLYNRIYLLSNCLNITNVSSDDSGLYIAFYNKNDFTTQLNVIIQPPTISLKTIIISDTVKMYKVFVTCSINHITTTASIFFGNIYVGKTVLISEVRYMNTNKTLLSFNNQPQNINYDEISLSLLADVNKLEAISDNYTYYCSVYTNNRYYNASINIKPEHNTINYRYVREIFNTTEPYNLKKSFGYDDLTVIVLVVCVLAIVCTCIYALVKWEMIYTALKNIKLKIVNVLFRRSFTPLNNVYYTEENQVGINVE
ncbi:F5L membrane protein [Hypsugopox virus]|nr:F5L membrane protein [Hypsugopox virus]